MSSKIPLLMLVIFLERTTAELKRAGIALNWPNMLRLHYKFKRGD